MSAQKTSERRHLDITIRREIAARLKQAAARRDLTVRQYVLQAVEDRIRADLRGHRTEVMTARTDAVLAQLWNNRRDAAYDDL